VINNAAAPNLVDWCEVDRPKSRPQRVLVLYPDERVLPANVIFDHFFRTTLEAGTSERTEFHSEFLDVSRFSGRYSSNTSVIF